MDVLDHHRRHQHEAASTCSYTKEGFGIPYYFAGAREKEEEECAQFHALFTDNKRVFRFKKIHSTRDRGRSGPFTSLTRKLGRFRVRYVLVQDAPPNDNR